jgi:hypothetical protein
MPASLNATICVDGSNYQSEESMPEHIRQAFKGVVAGALKARRSLFVGRTARFVPKLPSRIVSASGEFIDSGEMPSAERRVYEDAVAALLPGYFADRVAASEARLQRRNKLLVALASLAASTIWYNGCLTDSKFLFHFIRFLCGLT